MELVRQEEKQACFMERKTKSNAIKYDFKDMK